jgi:hypothetical protein
LISHMWHRGPKGVRSMVEPLGMPDTKRV